MNDSSVGDVMRSGRDNALRMLAIVAGILVYAGMIAYSGVHNWRLLTAGVDPSMRLWAGLGVVALEISAAALPLALHWWCHAPMQRIAAFAFYGLDLALITLNMVLDYSQVAQLAGDLPAWLSAYLFFVVPACPIIAGLGWSLLWLLDPSQRERSLVETLRAATRETLALRVAQEARQADVSEEVNQAAALLARDIVRSTLGVTLSRNTPAGVVDAVARDAAKPSRNGHKPLTVFNAEAVTVGEDLPNERGGEVEP